MSVFTISAETICKPNVKTEMKKIQCSSLKVCKYKMTVIQTIKQLYLNCLIKHKLQYFQELLGVHHEICEQYCG